MSALSRLSLDLQVGQVSLLGDRKVQGEIKGQKRSFPYNSASFIIDTSGTVNTCSQSQTHNSNKTRKEDQDRNYETLQGKHINTLYVRQDIMMS